MSDLQQQSTGTGNQQAGRDINNDLKLDADAVEMILTRRPSYVAKVIAALAQGIDEEEGDADTSITDPYGIQHKIDFNSVVKYREIFERYAGFGSIIDTVCENLDEDVPGIKRKLFRYIEKSYLLEKGEQTKNNASVSDKSDDIIDSVYTKLYTLVKQDSETEGTTVEDIEMSLLALTTKAFIDCKLLEHPPTT